ncbi:tetratricopeptide repeat protein [Leptospira ryugenii]|uniref:Tetratricopeptide repeat protein n=1 Tax=Leptospira ryugenii TaxID=1917863 RepID=A0A2P2E3T5_9LEPT|nr:hypothetical protein [Leptospira ryugenii]GBF51537.1 tetratricopeptide repeat protein [Leptospira ryugenii]
MRGILLLICLTIFSCRYPVKNQERIEEDRGFLLPPETEDSYSCNQKGIRAAKDGKIEMAEAIWDDCVQTNPRSVLTHLNRLRLFFLLEEYETFKKKVQKEAPEFQNPTYLAILRDLEEKYRLEEQVVLLDGLSRVKGWELYAYQELAEYYQNQGNINYAVSYWNQILEVNPFHEDALYGMVEIQIIQQKWYSVLDYAKSISVVAKKRKDYHYYFMKAYFELGEYSEAISWAVKATDQEKAQLSFLELWRDCLLLTQEDPKWDALLPHYRKLKELGYTIPESNFFPTKDTSGKELRKAMRSGRH